MALKKHRSGIQFAVAAMFALVLAACGGGGGGSDSGTPPDSNNSSAGTSNSSSQSSSNTSSASSSANSSSANSSSVSDIRWSVYDGSVLPNAAGSISLPSGTTGTFTVLPNKAAGYSWVNGFSLVGDGTVALDTTNTAIENRSQAQFNYVINRDGKYPKTLTFLTRVLPVSGVTYDNDHRLLEFDLALADTGAPGARVEGIIRNDATTKGIQINQIDGVDLKGTVVDMSVPHIYQVSVSLTSPFAGTVAVYVDGSDTPVIGPVTAANIYSVYANGDNYVRFGDGRASYYRSNIDWMIWTASGAYTPADLRGKLPSGIGVTTGY